MGILALATGLASFSKPWLGEGFASLILVVGLVVIGAIAGLIVALICAAVGAALFNFMVIEPLWQFRFQTASDFAAPAVFLLCAIVSGGLSGRVRDRSHRAHQANTRLESLLRVSRDLQAARSAADLKDILASQLDSMPELQAALFWHVDGLPHAIAGLSWAAPDNGPAFHHEPLTDGHSALGSIACLPARRSPEDTAYLSALAQLATLALTRLRLDSEVAESRVLARSELLKTALLSSVSHDFRTPLTTISTSAASLLTFGDEIDPQSRKDLLGNIVDECGRLNHLTENLLQMTRLQAGQADLSRSVLSAIEMIQRCITRLRPTAGFRSFEVNTPHADVLVQADAALFELALINVLQNAVKYSTDGSAITVTCTPHANTCVIAITDQGIGIPREEQARVFDRFYRASRRQPGPQGSGLGLTIAKGFVEASGGSIALTSPVCGDHGTAVTITLPLAQIEAGVP